MFEELESVEKIHREGRMAKRLKYTLLWLFLLGVLFFGLGLYDVIFLSLSILPSAVLLSAGFFAGYHFFWRAVPIEWDTKKAIAKTGRIDLTAFLIFIAYIALRFILKDALDIYYHDAIKASGLTSFAIAGAIFGRLSAMSVFMHKKEKKLQ